MLRIKELNLTCMINDSERITEKLGHRLLLCGENHFMDLLTFQPELKLILGRTTAELCGGST